jgi:uncharacterized repeat protein (TIGR04076 family)
VPGESSAGGEQLADEVTLFDLEVDVRCREGRVFVCSHEEGRAFRVVGENLVFDKPGSFSLYALAALLPLLPAKQRTGPEGDWMAADTDIACPDAACGAVFRIRRAGKTAFRREPPNTEVGGR